MRVSTKRRAGRQASFDLRETRSRSKGSSVVLLSILLAALAGATVFLAPGATESAIANGDTRTIRFYHAHTHESISATYLVDGQYDPAVLDKLNWFLRDWRREEATKMDPRLFDVIWEVYRDSGSAQPIEVMSAYRSPQTNAMLRRRSRGVAEHSQHILGKAMDQHYVDVPMSRIREIAMKLQRGGVGFYPTAGTPFVHMDVGGVRHWPRMSYDQLARLFPDGKTVHIPSNGQPLPGYEQARAELEARGDSFSYPTATEVKSKGFFAWLFGGGDDEADVAAANDTGSPRGRTRAAALAPNAASAPSSQYFGGQNKDGGAREFNLASAAPIGLFGNAPQPTPPQGRTALQATPVRQAEVGSSREQASEIQAREALGRAMVDSRLKTASIGSPRTSGNASNPVVQSPASPIEAPASTPGQFPAATEATSAGRPVPTPPRRPVELAAAGPSAPLPPGRPSDSETSIVSKSDRSPGVSAPKKDAIAALISAAAPIRTAGLPAAIVQGPGATKPPDSPQILAFAGFAPPAPPARVYAPLPTPRPPQLIAARLDRSNFRSLTGSGMAARVIHSSLGPTVTALRPAAQARLGAMAGQASPAAQSFRTSATDLSSDHFSGVAVRAQDRRAPAATGG